MMDWGAMVGPVGLARAWATTTRSGISLMMLSWYMRTWYNTQFHTAIYTPIFRRRVGGVCTTQHAEKWTDTEGGRERTGAAGGTKNKIRLRATSIMLQVMRAVFLFLPPMPCRFAQAANAWLAKRRSAGSYLPKATTTGARSFAIETAPKHAVPTNQSAREIDPRVRPAVRESDRIAQTNISPF